VGLIGPTVLSCQYSLLLHFHRRPFPSSSCSAGAFYLFFLSLLFHSIMAIVEYIVVYIASLGVFLFKKKRETLSIKTLYLARVARCFSKIACQDGVARCCFRASLRLLYSESFFNGWMLFNVEVIDVKEIYIYIYISLSFIYIYIFAWRISYFF